MTFWLLTAAITFGAFALVAAIASMVVAWSAPAVSRRLRDYPPAACASALFRLRLLPAALATLLAFGIVLPIFFAFESRATQEAIPVTVVLLATLGAALFARGGWRAAAAWRATRGVARDWQRRGRRLERFDTPLPVFAIEESFPTVAVVGVARPALFIAERVLRECGDEEIRAMLHHECAHVTKRDNLKRFVMRACPDFVGGDLDRAWARAAEEAADAAVVADDPGFAVELAQALIHVARLAPAPQAPSLASAFYRGGSIESRVRRLVEPAPARESAVVGGNVLVAAALGIALSIFASAPRLYLLIEQAVHSLP